MDADAQGRFEMKHVPAEGRAVRVTAKGYVGREVGFIDDLGTNGFKKYTVLLAGSASVKGVVQDTAGKPLAGAKAAAGEHFGAGRGYRLGGADGGDDGWGGGV